MFYLFHEKVYILGLSYSYMFFSKKPVSTYWFEDVKLLEAFLVYLTLIFTAVYSICNAVFSPKFTLILFIAKTNGVLTILLMFLAYNGS